jgi:hypothetical protein
MDINKQVDGDKRWPSVWRRGLVEMWPKIRTPIQLIVSQLISLAIRKWLG